MSELTSIQVEGQMTLFFGEDLSLMVEKPKATEGSADIIPIGMFSQFLQMIFTEGNMSAEEQAKVMQMTVAEFCQVYDNTATAAPTHQDIDNPVPLGIPRMQFLTNLSTYDCPHCGGKRSFNIVDGHLQCTVCRHDFGDIDDLRETLIT